MPTFYDIAVRFMRRIQVREYEPAEAEVTVKAQLADNDNVDDALTSAFTTASKHVHVALGLPETNVLPKRSAPSGQTETASTASQGRGGRGANKDKTQGQQAQTQQPKTNSDIPDNTPSSAGQAQTQQPQTTQVNSDIPDAQPQGQQTQQPQTGAAQTTQTSGQQFETLSPQDLSKWIGEQVRQGRVTSAEVMSLYPRFNVQRFADLKAEKCGEAKAAIEQLIKNKGPANPADL